MSWQRSIQAAIRALQRDEASLERELAALRRRIQELNELLKADGTPAADKRTARRRHLSPEGRQAISRAAKARWARYRAEQAKKEP